MIEPAPVQPVGLTIVTRDQVQVTVPVHVLQRYGGCIVCITADIRASHRKLMKVYYQETVTGKFTQ